MSLVTTQAARVATLNWFLNQGLKLKLYSNNVTPASTDSAATYTEVSGGGYAEKALTFASWVVTAGDPVIALFTTQTFIFTGATGAPGTVYGYYVVDSGGVLKWAERFVTVPITPINGSAISITPRFEGA